MLTWTFDALHQRTGVELAEKQQHMPWFARVILGVMGLFAGMFLTLTALCLLSDVQNSWLIMSLMTIIATVILRRIPLPDGLSDLRDYAVHVLAITARAGVSLSVWGAPLLVFGTLVTLTELALFIGMPDRLQRSISAFNIAGFGLYGVLEFAGIEPWMIGPYESQWIRGYGLFFFFVSMALWTLRPWLERGLGAVESLQPLPSALGHVFHDCVQPAAMGLTLFVLLSEGRLLYAPSPLDAWWGLVLGVSTLVVIIVLCLEHGTGFRLLMVAALGGLACLGTGFVAPGIPLMVLLILIAIRRRQPALLAVAVLYGVTYLAGFYYQLHASLFAKGATLLVIGSIMLLVRVILTPKAASSKLGWISPETMGTVFMLLFTLGLSATAIGERERAIATAETVYLHIRPVDPRSLVQGDYMTLAYQEDRSARGADKHIYLALTDDGVLFDGKDKPVPGREERKVRMQGMWSEPTIAQRAYLFEEGQGPLLAKAKFAEFRLTNTGELILIGLADERLQPLTHARKRW